MFWTNRLSGMLRALLHRRRQEQDLNDEVEAYFEIYIAREMEKGLSREAARRQVLIRFGRPEQVKQMVREARGLGRVEAVLGDVLHAWMVLKKSPGRSAVIILTLALATGANTAIFSVAKAVVLTPLPFREPHRVVYVFEGNKGEHYQAGRENFLMSVRPGKFQDWREQCRSFDGMSIVRTSRVILGEGEQAEAADAFLAGDGYFDLLGTPAQIGRYLGADDYTEDAARIAVLSDRLWRRGFNSDTGIVGRDIMVNGASYRVAGVMPRGWRDAARLSSSPWERPSTLDTADGRSSHQIQSHAVEPSCVCTAQERG